MWAYLNTSDGRKIGIILCFVFDLINLFTYFICDTTIRGAETSWTDREEKKKQSQIEKGLSGFIAYLTYLTLAHTNLNITHLPTLRGSPPPVVFDLESPALLTI